MYVWVYDTHTHTRASWQKGVDLASSIIVHTEKRRAVLQADWSVSSHSQSGCVCLADRQPAVGNSGPSPIVYKLKRRNQRKRGERHTCFCSIMYRAIDENRRDGEKGGEKTCNAAIIVNVCVCMDRVCMCVCVWGCGGCSAAGWAYPEDLFCFKRMRERSDTNSVPHTCAEMHTQARTLSALPTAERVSTPGPKSELQ